MNCEFCKKEADISLCTNVLWRTIFYICNKCFLSKIGSKLFEKDNRELRTCYICHQDNIGNEYHFNFGNGLDCYFCKHCLKKFFNFKDLI